MPVYQAILTDDQKQEFDTAVLQEFAKAYLEFRHSSPYTTKRKLFRYFEPMKPEELSEYDILFGRDREKAYADLLSTFKAALMIRSFDKFFETRNHHWQSETIPSLVILKKWLAGIDDAPKKKSRKSRGRKAREKTRDQESENAEKGDAA